MPTSSRSRSHSLFLITLILFLLISSATATQTLHRRRRSHNTRTVTIITTPTRDRHRRPCNAKFPPSICIHLQRMHRRQPQPLPPSSYKIDPRYGVQKRLVPTGPNPLHN
ncbi:unnamed protein product [Rhodiola kirilowii]